jgi:hypothetical protein
VLSPDASSDEAMKSLLSGKVKESSPSYHAASSPPDPEASTDEQTIDLKPEEDLISLNALGYALRVDPTRDRISPHYFSFALQPSILGTLAHE